MGRGSERPVFPADLADRLRERIAEGVGGLVLEDQLWMSKHKLNDFGRCEGLFAAKLLGEGTPFEHRISTAAGNLAHKAIELDVGREREDPSPVLVDRAAARLAEADGTFGAYWEGLDAIER